MASEKPFGIQRVRDHTLEFEPPDLCVVRFAETVTLNDCYAFMDLQNRLMEQHGGLFQLGDYTRVRSIEPEVRKLSAEGTAPTWLLGAVSFGLSFHVRVLAKLSFTLRALAKRDMNVRYQMVETEAEARAIIAQWRLEPAPKKGD